eukprot:333095-Hanusia_phi.AAC.1
MPHVLVKTHRTASNPHSEENQRGMKIGGAEAEGRAKQEEGSRRRGMGGRGGGRTHLASIFHSRSDPQPALQDQCPREVSPARSERNFPRRGRLEHQDVRAPVSPGGRDEER